MNRNEEYAALLATLEETPPALAYTIQRASVRRSKRRWGRLLGIPVGSVAVFLVSFTLLVNLLPTFARACGGVPVLRELALAVAWSPSLSAAVENDYVQPMNLEQTVNDITARIEYVIVDQKQLSIFFTLNSKVYDCLAADMPTFPNEDGVGCSIAGAMPDTENGELLQYTMTYAEKNVPDTLTLTIPVYQQKDPSMENGIIAPPEQTTEEFLMEDYRYEPPAAIAEFTFTLNLDPWYTAQGETLVIDRDFSLDGQTLTLQNAEVYPSHLRLNFTDTPDNTAWLSIFDFYLENEKGERFESISNGIFASGDMRNNGKMAFHMESSFFSDSEELTLYIQRVYWLDKDKERFLIDLEQGTADWLPDGIALEKTTRASGGWLISFTAKAYEPNHAYSIVGGFTDPAGNRVEMTGSSSSFIDEGEVRDYFQEQVPLRDYDEKQVYVEPGFSRVTEFETPIAVPVK